jgi:Gon7 family
MSAPAQLTAHYTSPGCSAKHFIYSLPELSSNPSTADRTAYLSKLRAEAVELQSSINAFLTQKMGEDNAASGKPAVDDVKEEENYGEEVVEEDG